MNTSSTITLVKNRKKDINPVLLIRGTAVLVDGEEGGQPQKAGSSSNTVGADAPAGNEQSNSALETSPSFTLDRLEGGKLSLADYQGKKMVVLDFFATWCPNCRRNMPRLSAMYEKYKDQVEVIGVNMGESEGAVRSYIESSWIAYPIVLDPGSTTAISYGVFYTNYHVFINSRGKIVAGAPGDVSEEQILALINGNN